MIGLGYVDSRQGFPLLGAELRQPSRLRHRGLGQFRSVVNLQSTGERSLYAGAEEVPIFDAARPDLARPSQVVCPSGFGEVRPRGQSSKRAGVLG